MAREIEVIIPSDFEADQHFYPKALNAQMHPLVNHFFSLNHDRIISRYTHLNPMVSKESLQKILGQKSKWFYWGGADLFYVTTEAGNRRMIVIETNSCPSGQKSLPNKSDDDEYRGYRELLEHSFFPNLKGRRLPPGVLAVIYDKNYMEASGYASVMADISNENVYLIPCFNNEEENKITIDDGVLQFEHEGKTIPIRAAFRYVTQKPWNRLPPITKTFVHNPVLVCLAGGRNKLLASKAYELYNSKIYGSGLMIHAPETIRDVNKLEVPFWVERFGGAAVVKNPYSNAGQGVYTITSKGELERFMELENQYDQFIVQSLVGHYNWSSISTKGRYFHIGTVPNKKSNIYVADLRMMVSSSPEGFKPVAVYARRTRTPLPDYLKAGQDSWEVLGTNLSIKKGENEWDSDTSRLMLMDRKDFNTLGIGLDDLVEAYIQTVLSVNAIDEMATQLISSKGSFRRKFFKSLDNDPTLMEEIYSP